MNISFFQLILFSSAHKQQTTAYRFFWYYAPNLPNSSKKRELQTSLRWSVCVLLYIKYKFFKPSIIFFTCLQIGLFCFTGLRRVLYFSLCFSPCTGSCWCCTSKAQTFRWLKNMFPRACSWICVQLCRNRAAQLPECVTCNDNENPSHCALRWCSIHFFCGTAGIRLQQRGLV